MLQVLAFLQCIPEDITRKLRTEVSHHYGNQKATTMDKMLWSELWSFSKNQLPTHKPVEVLKKLMPVKPSVVPSVAFWLVTLY